MIDLDLLKETISELMGADYSPNISQQALDNYADRKDMERAQSGPADIFNKKVHSLLHRRGFNTSVIRDTVRQINMDIGHSES